MIVTLDEYADLRTLPGPERLFKLLSPFNFTLDGKRYALPQGFTTDLASIPGIAEWFIDNDSPKILRPALIHDAIYQNTGYLPGYSVKFTRAEADEILREAMAVCGAGWFTRWNVWAHVRAYGAFAWKPHNYSVRMSDLRAKIRMANTIDALRK